MRHKYNEHKDQELRAPGDDWACETRHQEGASPIRVELKLSEALRRYVHAQPLGMSTGGISSQVLAGFTQL